MSHLPTVLLIDDGADDRTLLGLVLRGAFGEVTIEEATDAPALARAMVASRFGLVITEHTLPWIRAGEVLRLVRDLRPGVPVVVLTARPLSEAATELIHLRPDAVVPKTSTGLSDLPAVLRRVQQESADSPSRVPGAEVDALEELAYVLSHDLRQPVNQVARYLELLEQDAGKRLGKPEQELLAHARRGALRLETLVDGVLRYASAAHGATFAPVSLEEVLERALERLAEEREASRAEVTHDPLPTIEASAPQMDQLFHNLLANAFKFRGEQAARVHVDAEANGNLWHLRMRDHGIGVDPKDAQRIFGLFQRLHTEDEILGSGIGLALCKRIVARHGGRIWVVSRPGAGATFHWTLALHPAASAARGED